MQSSRLLRALVSRSVGRNYHKSTVPQTTYNDMPSPQGSFQTQYEANQRRYNAHLALGIGFFVFTVIVAKSSGLVYLNYAPPEKPSD